MFARAALSWKSSMTPSVTSLMQEFIAAHPKLWNEDIGEV